MFGFIRDGKPVAAAAKDVEAGRAFAVRGFDRAGSGWVEAASKARFDPAVGRFAGSVAPVTLEGFDMFWYVWSPNFPDTMLLGR